MLKVAAVIFGICFLGIGVWEFFNVGKTLLLFDYFIMSSAYYKLHFVCGIVAFAVTTSDSLTRLYFQILCAFYGSIALLGFANGSDLSLVMLQGSRADDILHAVLAVGILVLLSVAPE